MTGLRLVFMGTPEFAAVSLRKLIERGEKVAVKNYFFEPGEVVTRQSSESAFDYLASVTGFWRSLCRATIAAGRVGPVTSDQKVTNYIIGLSFTAEMSIIGVYERTFGAATVWARCAGWKFSAREQTAVTWPSPSVRAACSRKRTFFAVESSSVKRSATRLSDL